MKTLAEKIAVMQAAERGEQIERLGPEPGWSLGGANWKWETVDTQWIGWDWCRCDYRVAPRTMEIVVVSWKRDPGIPFCLEKKSYDTRGDKEEMILHSTQTITY